MWKEHRNLISYRIKNKTKSVILSLWCYVWVSKSDIVDENENLLTFFLHLLLVYIISIIITIIIMIIIINHNHHDHDHHHHRIRCNLLTFVSHLLLVVNSSVNILIYCWKVGYSMLNLWISLYLYLYTDSAVFVFE